MLEAHWELVVGIHTDFLFQKPHKNERERKERVMRRQRAHDGKNIQIRALEVRRDREQKTIREANKTSQFDSNRTSLMLDTVPN